MATVAEYQEAFEKLSHRVDGLPEHFLIGCFIAGLKDDIRLDVQIKNPTSLAEAIGVARLVEERNQLQRRLPGPNRPSAVTPIGRNAPSTTVGLLGPPPGPRTTPSVSPPVRRISNQEARERRDKGLCYYCDEKFVPGHRCK